MSMNNIIYCTKYYHIINHLLKVHFFFFQTKRNTDIRLVDFSMTAVSSVYTFYFISIIIYWLAVYISAKKMETMKM